jgi:hypothetical protein
MRLSLAFLLLCAACTEHGKGGGMVCQGLIFVPSPEPPAEVTTCTSQIAGDPETLYASCDDGFPNLFECVAPNGSGVCLDGRRTTLCQLDTDCIPGFRCAETFGIRACEKECEVDLDCIRCELFCDTNEGVCSEAIAMPGGGGEDL